MEVPATLTPDIWITDVMTGTSGANMSHRKVNRAEWHYRYRQRHLSGGSTTTWQQLTVHQSLADQLQNRFCIISVSVSAASASLSCKIHDGFSPNQTNGTNTLPSLYIREIWGFPSFFHVHYSLRYMKELLQCGRHAGELVVSCWAWSGSSWESWDPFWVSGGLKTLQYSSIH